MKEYGFIRVGAVVPELKVANPKFNVEKIVEMIKDASKKEIGVLVFPELSITGYTCADLFMQDCLLKEALGGLERIKEETKKLPLVVIVGAPLKVGNQLYNCAVLLQKGHILGAIPKTYIPNYNEFYEKRWFASSEDLLETEITLFDETVPIGTNLIFEDQELKEAVIGVEICEDLWSIVPPTTDLALNGATLLFNLSSSNEIIGKYEYRKDLVKNHSAKLISGYIYTSSGINESTTDVVFSGEAMISENGSILKENERFQFESNLIYQDIDVLKLHNMRIKDISYMGIKPRKGVRRIKVAIPDTKTLERKISKNPFVPSNLEYRNVRCSEIFRIQASGLAKRLRHIGCKKTVIGISGGLDSTLAFLVIAEAYRMLGISYDNIIAVTMPGFGTTSRTLNNSISLMEKYDVTIREIPIVDASLLHMKDIGHDKDIHDVTYENVQARERTQILMDIANREGGLVIGTGDLSELALGWCTYNGDHMSMYAVNTSIPKTLVKYLVRYVADTNEDVKQVLYDILDTPISPELLPPTKDGKIKQKTEDKIGPYELHDFFLYHFFRYGAEPKKILFMASQVFDGEYSKDEIKKWLIVFLKRFFSQQFKRSCLPDGPKVGTISLSPRGDLRMPSDADVEVWLNELENQSK